MNIHTHPIIQAVEHQYWCMIETYGEYQFECRYATGDEPRCQHCDGEGIVSNSTHDLPVLCHKCQGVGRVIPEFVAFCAQLKVVEQQFAAVEYAYGVPS